MAAAPERLAGYVYARVKHPDGTIEDLGEEDIEEMLLASGREPPLRQPASAPSPAPPTPSFVEEPVAINGGAAAAAAAPPSAPRVRDQAALRAADVAADPARLKAAGTCLCERCEARLEGRPRDELSCSGQAHCPIKVRS